MDTKKTWRDRLRRKVDRMPKAARVRASAKIRKLLWELIDAGRPGRIFAFASTDHEPDLGPLYSRLLGSSYALLFPKVQGKRIVFYRVADMADLRTGAFEIREPFRGNINSEIYSTDLVLVPCVGLDEDGWRLGHGGGFYDRWLNKHPSASCLAVVFYSQLVPALPHTKGDAKLPFAITETGYFTLNPKKSLKF